MKGVRSSSKRKASLKKNGKNNLLNDERNRIMAMKYNKTLVNKKHEEFKAGNGHIKTSLRNHSKKSAVVVIENLSLEKVKKYLKNQSTNEISKMENIQLKRLKRSCTSEKLPAKKIQSDDNVNNIFGKEHDDRILDLSNNIDLNNKLNDKRKYYDRSFNKIKMLRSAKPFMVSNKMGVSTTQRTLFPECYSVRYAKEAEDKLHNFGSTCNETVKRTNPYVQCENIIDSKVMLTKLEDIHDDIYINIWKKKCAQEGLVFNNSGSTKDISMNTLPTETIDSIHKNVTEDSDSRMKTAMCVDSFKHPKVCKVLLVKLEKLRTSCEGQNSVSTIKHSTVQEHIDQFKLNCNHSSNVSAYNNKVSKSINKNHYLNSSTKQLENNSLDCLQTILQDDLHNSKHLLETSSCTSVLTKTQQDESLSTARSETCATIPQKCLERVSDLFFTEVVEDKLSKRNSELKKIGTVSSVLNKRNISSKTDNATLELTNEINCEDIEILQNNEIIDNNEQSILDDVHKKLNYRENVNSDIIEKANSITKLPENMQLEQQQQQNILQSNATEKYYISYGCFYCKLFFKDIQVLQLHKEKCSLRIQRINNAENINDKHNLSTVNDILKISKYNTSDSSLQQSNNTESSTSSNINSSFTNSKDKTKKRHKNREEDECSRRKVFKNDDNNSLQCKESSKLFNSIINLSNHICSHIKEKKFHKEYKRSKNKQNSNLSIRIDDSNKETQECNQESLISMEGMRLQKNTSVETSLETLTTDLNKNESIKNSTNHEKLSFTFCSCHEKHFEIKNSIEVVLLCNICNVLYLNMECFLAHLENKELYLCNGKKLTKKISKLYCNICKEISCDPRKMYKHMENHLNDFKSVKLFCHICKIRFIGMGPIFLKHWSHHDLDVFYKASKSHFRKTSIVDETSKEWSIINSDGLKYLVITEHVCNNCDVQFFSTNQLKDHMSSCINDPTSKSPSIRPSKDHINPDVQSELDMRLDDIDKITPPNKCSSEEHTASQKNNLNPENMSKLYDCKVCSNTFESVKKLTIHLKDCRATPINFSCHNCKESFENFVTYIHHLNHCIKEKYPINDFFCDQKETSDSCRASNEHQTNDTKFPNCNTVYSSISSYNTSNHSTDQIKQNNKDVSINESISETSINQNSIVNQLIDFPSNSSSSILEEIVSDDISLSNQNITSQDIENLSSVSYVKIENEIKIDENTCQVNNDSNKNDNRKDLNDQKTVISNSPNSKQKTVLDINIPLSKTIDTKENDNDITLIKSEIPWENQENSHENSRQAVEPTTNLQLNNSTNTSEESVKPKKYLRVRNISELVDQSSKYNIFNNRDESTSTAVSSSTTINLPDQEQTESVNLSNFQQQSVSTSSDPTQHRVDTINHFQNEERGFIFSNAQGNPKQCLFSSSAIEPTLPQYTLASTSNVLSSSVLKSAPMVVSVQNVAEIKRPQLTQREKSLISKIMLEKNSQIATPTEQLSPSIEILNNVSCTTQPQVSNIQYSSTTTTTTPNVNSYSRDHTYAEINLNYVNCITYKKKQQSEKLINVSSFIPMYSATNNNQINTSVIQKNNNELCKTASTSRTSISQLTNNVSRNNLMKEQPHNSHNLIRVQNQIHGNLNNKVASKGNYTDITSQNRTDLHVNKEIYNPPVRPNQYYNYNTSCAEYLLVNNRNLTQTQRQHSTKNNNSPNFVAHMTKQSNNQLHPIFRKSSFWNSEFEVFFQQHFDYPCQLKCNYCSDLTVYFTRQQYEIHMNTQHNFICNLCKCRFYTLAEIEDHRLKRHNTDFSNTY